MNDQADTDLSAASTEPVAEAAAKPVRRRRSPKAEAAASDESAAATPLEAGAEDTAESQEAPKPARTRRPRAKPVAADGEAVAEFAPETEPGAAASPVTAASVVTAAPEALAVADASGAQAPSGMAEEGEAQSVAEAGQSGSDADRRGGRRRDRRGGEGRGASPREEQLPEGGQGRGPVAQEAAGAVDPALVADAQARFDEVLSGAYDESAETPADTQAGAEGSASGDAAAAEADKRVLLPEPEAPKLHKVLAQSGIGSRRDMEKLIEDGLVEVNGEVAHTGQRVSVGDQVKVRGKPVRIRILQGTPRVLAYHKPVGEVVTFDDPQGRPTVFRNLPRLQQGKWQSVGRLDINTEGLLLFTNSGELANQLMHPRFGVEREYAVRVLGTLEPDARARLLEGVDIEGQKASFKSIENGGGEGVNHWYRVVITEGRNREVRKLFDAVGLVVSRLIRIRYGTVVLPRGLKRGVWVDLPEADVKTIRRLASPHQARPRPQGGEEREGGHERGGERGNDRSRNKNAGARNGQPAPNERGGRGGRASQFGKGGRGNGLAQERRPRDDQRPRMNEDAASPRSSQGGEDWEDDFDPSRIPNPLEQTFDKRFVKNPRMPAGGRGFRHGGGGFGAGGSAQDNASPQRPKKGGPREPDPLQTSVGYIGADAYHSRSGRGGGGRGGSGGGRRGR